MTSASYERLFYVWFKICCVLLFIIFFKKYWSKLERWHGISYPASIHFFQVNNENMSDVEQVNASWVTANLTTQQAYMRSKSQIKTLD